MIQRINVADFNLAATLECGQAFRWSRGGDGWYAGVVGGEIWRVRQIDDGIEWRADPPHPDPLPIGERGKMPVSSPPPFGGEDQGEGVRRYLSLDLDLKKIVSTFPADEQLRQAVKTHWGLRVLRQEPWETLASFIASSTKQIVQIRQIVALLAERFGRAGCPQPAEAERHAEGSAPYHAFPNFDVIARATPQQLLDCKLGFRAKYLLAAARMVESGAVRLLDLPAMEYGRALEELLKIPGVGEKIANCMLLFSCGHHEAFPVDVHVQRSLRRLFPRRKMTPQKIRSHFGLYGGWAQQYLFYAERTRPNSPFRNHSRKLSAS